MWCILPSVVSAARTRCPHAIFSLYATRLRCDKPYSDLLYITLECSRAFLNQPMRTVIPSYHRGRPLPLWFCLILSCCDPLVLLYTWCGHLIALFGHDVMCPVISLHALHWSSSFTLHVMWSPYCLIWSWCDVSSDFTTCAAFVE